MPSSFSRLAGTTRRRAVLIGAGALTVVAVGAGTTAAFAADPSASASASASSSTSTHQYPGVGAIFRQLPHSLRADLKTLKKDSASQKAAEKKSIEQKALSGAYGGDVSRIAHLFAGGSDGKVASVIPAAMRADLKVLRKDAKGSSAREAEATTIWTKAIGGSYGTTIETAAKAALTKYQAHHKG